MTAYKFITNEELAKDVDLILDVLINYYSSEEQGMYGPKGVTAMINKLGTQMTEEKVRSVMSTMTYFNITEPRMIPEKGGIVTSVTNMGHYIYNNGGLFKYIKQENEDKEIARNVNRSVIDTNVLVKRTTIFQIWILVLSTLFSGTAVWYTKKEAEYQEQELNLHKEEHAHKEQQSKEIIHFRDKTVSRTAQKSDSTSGISKSTKHTKKSF